MKKLNKEIVLLALYMVFIVIAYLFGFTEHNAYLTKSIALFTPLPTLYFGVLATRYFGLGSQQGKSTIYITSAVALWWIANIIWWFFAANSIVSLADAFWFFGFILFILGIMYGLHILALDIFGSFKSLFFIVPGIFLLSAAFFTLVPFSWNPESSLAQNLFTKGYLIGDLLLIVGCSVVSYITYRSRKGIYSHHWILFGIGSLFFFAGDMFYMPNANFFKPGGIIELLWHSGYMFFAFAFVLQRYNTMNLLDSYKSELLQKKIISNRTIEKTKGKK
jgi:hypothetical protein